MPERKRILFADDQPAMRILFGAMLGGGGYQVQLAADGREALTHLRQSGADLVLLDLQMPELDGLGALKAIRSDAQLQALPVLATSAYGMPAARDTALAAGFDGFIEKPFSRQSLLTKIAELLA